MPPHDRSRRRFLTSAAVGAAAVTGCLGTDRRTSTPGSTDTSSPSITDRSFTADPGSCGEGTNAASIATDAAAGTITVEGTIWGSDACARASLERADYAAPTDQLTVHVGTRRADADACADCIVDIDYTAAVTFTGGLPDTVAVVHGTGDREETVVTESTGR